MRKSAGLSAKLVITEHVEVSTTERMWVSNDELVGSELA